MGQNAGLPQRPELLRRFGFRRLIRQFSGVMDDPDAAKRAPHPLAAQVSGDRLPLPRADQHGQLIHQACREVN